MKRDNNGKSIPPELFLRLKRAKEFMDECYHMPLELPQICEHACFSKYHFIRAFRSAFEQTPHQYLTRRRIEKAKELLQSTRMSVTDVCFEVGFQSLGSFSTLFQKVVGHSPLAYRVRWIHVRESVWIPVCYVAKWNIPSASSR